MKSKKGKAKVSRRINHPVQKTGMPPGVLIFTGKQRMEQVEISLLAYNESQIEEFSFDDIESAIKKMKELDQVLWLNITGLHDTELIKKVVTHFNLHKLSGEDILNVGQRPKLDVYEDYTHIAVKSFQTVDKIIDDEQITIIFSANLLISFQEKTSPVFDYIKDRLFQSEGQIRRRQSDYLAYALLDTIVDQYFVTIDQFGDVTEDLEDDILKNPTEILLSRLNELRQEASYLRRSIYPLREVTSRFEKLECSYIHKETKLFIRDLYDNTVQAIENISFFKDSVTNLLDLYMSSVSNRMNNVMKLLTIVSTIFIPLTFIVGVYGMNFSNMPELSYKYGYLFTMIGMALLTLFMILYFKRKKWL